MTVLNVSHNKEQFIEIITEKLLDRVQGLWLLNSLVVTGKSDTPVEVKQGVRDLRINHKEADVIIQFCFQHQEDPESNHR